MARTKPALSRREQQVLDIIYAHGHATAAEVRERMHDAPTDPAVRTTLRILVAKGHLRIEQNGPRYDYWPTGPRETASRSEMQPVLRRPCSIKGRCVATWAGDTWPPLRTVSPTAE